MLLGRHARAGDMGYTYLLAVVLCRDEQRARVGSFSQDCAICRRVFADASASPFNVHVRTRLRANRLNIHC